MSERVLITGGRIVTAVDDFIGDILVEGETITAVGRDLSPLVGDAERHDATGLIVLPGGVDVHTHLDNDSGKARTCDTFETGGMAAAFGGTTTLVDYAVQHRGESPLTALENWRQRAASATVDVGAHMIMLDTAAPFLEDTRRLIRDEGVTSLKVFMAYPGALMVDDGSIFHAMRVTAAEGGMVCVHAENGPVIEILIQDALAAGRTAPRYHALSRPAIMEGEATHRVIKLAELAETPVYIVHLSAAQSLETVTEARDRAIPVFAETCPHYLFLDESVYDTPDFIEGAKAIMTPPLRAIEHQQALWKGLATNDLQVVSTDHCPYCAHEATMGRYFSKWSPETSFHSVPNGAPGLETRLPLLFDAAIAKNRLSLNRLVDITATAPAKLFGLFPRKGTIAVGSDADLVLFDPAAGTRVSAAEHHSRIDYSLFEGFELKGAIRKVFLRGRMIVEGDAWHGRAGMGAYLPRSASGAVRL